VGDDKPAPDVVEVRGVAEVVLVVSVVGRQQLEIQPDTLHVIVRSSRKKKLLTLTLT